MLNTEWLCPAWNQVQDAICGNRAQYLVENTSYCEIHAYDSVYIPRSHPKNYGIANPVLSEKMKSWVESKLTSTQAWNLYQDAKLWTVTGKGKSISRGRFNNIFYELKKRLIENVAEWRVRDREEFEAKTKGYRRSSQKKKEDERSDA